VTVTRPSGEMKKLPLNLAAWSLENYKLGSLSTRDIARTLVSIQKRATTGSLSHRGDINRKLVIDGSREAGSRERSSRFDGDGAYMLSMIALRDR